MELPENIMELLAAIEHERWASWQKYLHSCCIPLKERVVDPKKNIIEYKENGCLVIPKELVDRWERQIETKYEDLSEKEKESDREQVRRYLPIITNL